MARQDPKAPRQLELLPTSALLPAPVHEGLTSLRSTFPATLHLGTSSWSFPGWHKLVYGAQYTPTQLSQRGLHPYAQHPLLRTVGIDSTHYQPLPAQALRDFAAQTPPDFRFLMKAHEACTLARYPLHKRYGANAGLHNSMFFDSDYATQRVVLPWIEGMQERAGVLLFQLAAQDVALLGGPQGFPKRLAAFLRGLPQGPCYAVEVRNPQILTPAYGRALADNQAVHCFNAHPNMPPVSAQQRAMGNPSWHRWVVRWMLHDGLRYEEGVARYRPFARMMDPDPQTRAQLVRLIRHASGCETPTFVIVNNKAEGSAPLSIVALAMAIAGLEGV